MMLNPQEIVDDNMVVEGYEEIAVDDINELVVEAGEEGQEITFEEDEIRSVEGDGYGGMPVDMYNDIVEYKRTGNVPNNMDKRMDRSAPSHWRARCNRFTMADDGDTLLYFNPTSPVNDQPKVVVKKGEVRKVLERIHELIGHLGQKRTQMVVLRKLYWRSVRQDVKNYIMSCDFCNQKKVEGRKIVKAPVDITSDSFDISVSVRDQRSGPGERLELTLVGYNEQEVRDAAFTRMTSYTFKETATEFRSRFSLANPPVPTFRRQPYVKRNGQMAIGYLLPYQQRSRAMEPEFIEIYERNNVTYTEGIEGEEFEQVEEEIVEPLGDGSQIKQVRQNVPQNPQPVTFSGQVLQAKKFFKEEDMEEEIDVERTTGNPEGKPKKEGAPNVESIRAPAAKAQQNRVGTRYGGKRSVPVHHEGMYQQEDGQIVIEEEPTTSRRSGQQGQTTSSNMGKKRRREGPSIHGMASRFSMAIGETERLDTNDTRNDQHAHMMQFESATTARPELHGLPPVCMMPSLDPQVTALQKEMLQRQIRLQKLQEKVYQAQYEASMRIPMTRYVQPTEHEHEHEHVVQEENIEVDHELNVMDEHAVYEDEQNLHEQ